MYTLSWHQGGDRVVRQAHNRREAQALGRSSQIDSTRTKDNLVLVDIPIQQAYKKLFGEAQAEYNARTRESRQIQDYYTYICKSNKQTAYEAIVQIGSMSEGVPQKAVGALKRYVEEWGTRNPNLFLAGAYIHQDEAGAVHLHANYIPVAECNRGMRIQNSLTRALYAQGFKTKSAHATAQIQWEQSERDAMRQICAQMGIELYAQGKGRTQHYTIGEYKERQEQLKATQASLKAAKAQEEEIFTSVTLTYQQIAQAEKDASERQAQTNRQYIDIVQKKAVLQRKLDESKAELDSLQCRVFSLKQDAQEKQEIVKALEREIQHMKTDYTTAYSTALQNRAIAILRADPTGAEWWAWAVDTASGQEDIQICENFMQYEQEEPAQDYYEPLL